MRIDSVRTYHVSKPLKQKLVNSRFTIDRMEHVLLELDAGEHTGIGFVFTLDHDQAKALRVLVESFAHRLIGTESDLIRRHWNNAHAMMEGVGQTGMALIAWAAIDTALWDLTAKRAGLPLYRILGAHRDEVPVYASGGWLVPLEQLVREARDFKAAGFRRYKMKVGCADYRDDLERIEKVRSALGDEVEVMIDANQGWTAKKSIEIAPMLLELGVTYLEEPVFARDYGGHAEIRRSSAIRVAAGESLFGKTEIFELLRQDGVDVLNPDLQRCGGITGFLEVSALADAYRIPVSSHLFTEASSHVLAAAPSAVYAEYVPEWWSGIFTREPDIVEGMLRLGGDPGLGIEFDHGYVENHAV